MCEPVHTSDEISQKKRFYLASMAKVLISAAAGLPIIAGNHRAPRLIGILTSLSCGSG
jgi:hypothetical protein